MRIKYFSLLFLCFPMLLLAQLSEPVKHVGTSNLFQIGSTDNPVIVEEFVDFLNTKERNNSYYENSPFFSDPSIVSHIDYYDRALMDESSSERCILFSISSSAYKQAGVFFAPCIGVSITYGPQPYYHVYSVKQGCESIIVDAVVSQEVQQQFNQWRQNPTVQELCDYINNLNHAVNESDESHDLLHNPAWDKAEEIENRYPNSEIFLTAYGLAEKICVGTTRATLAKMEKEAPGTTLGKGYFLLDWIRDDCNTPLIGSGDNGQGNNDILNDFLFTLPDPQSDSLYPEIPKYITVIPGMKYFRPTEINDFVKFYF